MSDDSHKAKVNRLKGEIAAAKEKLLNGSNPNDVLFNAGGASKADGGNIKVRRQLKGHFGKVYAIHWAGNTAPEKLVSASQDGKLIVWDADSTNKTKAIPLRSSWVMTCSFERQSNKLVACGGLDNLCSIYDATIEDGHTLGKAEKELAHHDGYLSCCRFVSEKEIITSSGDSTCIQWDTETQQPKLHFALHTSDVMSIALSPDNPNIFVSGSCDATCITWDMRKKGYVSCYEGHESDVNSVEFFPDGKAFGTGSDDSSCRIFDMRSCNQVASLEAEKILCGVTSVCFTSSGRFLAAGYDDYTLGIWDILGENRDVIRDHPGSSGSHENRVSCIGTEVSGRAVATGSWDTCLKCWA